MEVVVLMMMEILASLKTGEGEAEIEALAEDYIPRLTGKQTVYQMIELAKQLNSRGGIHLSRLPIKGVS